MRVAVMGLGLIGGSVALALAEAGHDVVGYDTDPATRSAAAERFAVAEDPRALRESDLAVVAVPLRLTGRSVRETFAPGEYSGIVTDVASVKQEVLRQSGAHPRFVAGHPMAGKETAGFAAAEAGLFAGRTWVLCLEEDTDLDAWATTARLWTSLGARVVPTTAAAHDAAVARVSHVEHLVAAALTLNAADPLARTLGSGSFRDGTRVAASPASLVEGMAEGNRDGIIAALEGLARELEAAFEAVADGPGAGLGEWWERARELRSTWPDEPAERESIQLNRENLLDLGAAGGWVESMEVNEVATVCRPRVKSTP
ncbi:prephenate dehydrogenase [Glycomyces salinus]|uniref:prephenate dehydrogenase n=1 Tax=Glycomyces salinus TaxID=980294 RepID=UPI0018EC3BDA|nr:prephenate dehydrogenase/arogenate dehydrogenase family protein [Glycomyces salinus]